jgi:hypothetical protein
MQNPQGEGVDDFVYVGAGFSPSQSRFASIRLPPPVHIRHNPTTVIPSERDPLFRTL